MNRMNHAQIETKNSLPQSIRIQSVGLLNRNLALAIDGGILKGTAIRILPTTEQTPSREIGLVWRRGTGRQREFELLASVLTQLVEERPRP